MSREPAHQRPGARVRYNYTDGPVPAGTLGTILGFLPRSQQAQIRWDDDTVNNHTPDEYDVVPRGTRRPIGEAQDVLAAKYFERGARLRIRSKGANGQPFEAFWFLVPSEMTPEEVALQFAQTVQPGMLLEIEEGGGVKRTFRQNGDGTVTPVPNVSGRLREIGESRRQTKWSDWDILDAVERRHGMTPEAKARAFELIDLGYIDAAGTWELTPRGRRAWERDAPKGGWSNRHQQAPRLEARRQMRRQTVHAAPTSGWTSGKRPSHAEIWADGKPITVAKSGRKWTVTVMGRPVVNGASGGLTFEGRSDYVDGLTQARFNSKGDADSVAHKIGRYMLNLGDFVHTYVEHVG